MKLPSLSKFFRNVEESGAVEKLLNFIPVQGGDFVEVPAGTIHAIGGGVTLLEFQQASGITYRLWDWGREGRELHIEKGKLVSLGTLPKKKRFPDFEMKNLFYIHSDFELLKISSRIVECSSRMTNQSFEINLESFEVKLAVK